MPTTILVATTNAANSQAITVNSEPVHFTCPGIVASETAPLQKQNVAGGWDNYSMPNDANVISASRAGVVAYAAGIYRIAKGATASPVPVEISTYGSP